MRSVVGRRLACHAMIQPDAARGVLSDPVLRDQGFLSRFLPAAPDSLAGERMWKEPAAGIEPALRRYTAVMLDIFEIPVLASNALGNELTPRELPLSAEARELWVGLHDEIERDMRAGRRFSPNYRTSRARRPNRRAGSRAFWRSLTSPTLKTSAPTQWGGPASSCAGISGRRQDWRTSIFVPARGRGRLPFSTGRGRVGFGRSTPPPCRKADRDRFAAKIGSIPPLKPLCSPDGSSPTRRQTGRRGAGS